MSLKALFQPLFVYLIGIVTGIQVALYLFDYYDDGVAETKSLLIGLGMLALSLAYIVYRSKKKASVSDSG